MAHYGLGDVIADAQGPSRWGGSYGLPGWVRQRRSEEETLTRLIRDNEAAIRRLAHSILKDPRDEEEAVSDTFAKAHGKWSQYRREASERTWLRTICCNVCVDKLRLRRRQADCSPLDPEHEPPGCAEEAELRVALWQEINDLPDDWRAAFTLKLKGYKITAIAKLMGKKRTTVSGHHHAACERLKERLYPPPDEPPREGS